MSLPRFDENGYAVPACDVALDELNECGANDPEAGEPETWLSWTDADVWELGPAIPPDAVLSLDDFEELAPELFQPADADLKWAAEHFNLTVPPIAGGAPDGPTAEDWKDYATWDAETFGVVRGGPITDEDIAIATGACG